jgi:hypothetical protein
MSQQISVYGISDYFYDGFIQQGDYRINQRFRFFWLYLSIEILVYWLRQGLA